MSDGSTLQARDDPGPNEHPGHATRLLALVNDLLENANMGWNEIDRIAVGLGPGTLHGPARRAGDSARASTVAGGRAGWCVELACAGGAGAAVGLERSGVLAVLDARRGEAFAVAYEMTGGGGAEELIAPRALAPEELGRSSSKPKLSERMSEEGSGWR